MSNEIQLALNGYGQGLPAQASPFGGALGTRRTSLTLSR